MIFFGNKEPYNSETLSIVFNFPKTGWRASDIELTVFIDQKDFAE